MRKFHATKIIAKTRDTADSVTLLLAVPDEIADAYRYREGQHLPVRARIGEKSVRRTYSICASVAEQRLQLGVRVQEGGVFSNYIADSLQPGDTLDAMPPIGQFHVDLDPANEKHYAAFVAGSGITPVYSIVKTTLETEPQSRFTVFYGNRGRATTMLLEPLQALKNLYPQRLALHFVMSQETSEIDLYAGRIDGPRAVVLYDAFLRQTPPDEVFICGPHTMIAEVEAAMLDRRCAPEHIHTERYRVTPAGEAATTTHKEVPGEGKTRVTVIQDGHRLSFEFAREGQTLLEAAEDQGLDLPYSCRGGVCSTCRTKLTQGRVEMDVNYALEPWETEQGFILACQSRPLSAEIELDYDQT